MKYSIWQNIKYRLNYSKTVIRLHADLQHLPQLPALHHFKIREINIEDPTDLKKWAELVTDAYQDFIYNESSAINHFNNHLFLNIVKGYFVMDEDDAIATISIGTYKRNPKIGGDARIAVKREYQGHGLGKYVIIYGFNQLRNMGIKYAESIISIPREQSIFLHFQCGFIPQYNDAYYVFNSQKRFWFINKYVSYRLKKIYSLYKLNLSKKFIN